MRTPVGVFIFLSLMLLLDFYVFQSVKAVSQSASSKTKFWIYTIYWSMTALSIFGFLLFVYTDVNFLGKKIRTYLFATIIGLFLAKFASVFVFIADDIRRVFQFLFTKLYSFSSNTSKIENDDTISRSVFLSWIGLAAGSTIFGSLLYGFNNKYKYRVIRQKLSFSNLPHSFKGLKIVHISDIHSGSLLDIKEVAKGVEKIIAQKADLILFTGDLVNDKASEMQELKHVFGRLKAPLGVYSVLGNHDYGDYVQWPIDGVSKDENLERLKNVHESMGWRLLLNEHVVIERGEHKIALLGIENWSDKARFPKYGKLNEAHQGTENYAFKILMSHDPSHWHAQVRKEYKDIDLMLSGHTHGMQFGVELPGFKWSPVQYVYKEWAGLYEDENQKLYVNRGFGFLGYPGRVGVLPEITVIELI